MKSAQKTTKAAEKLVKIAQKEQEKRARAEAMQKRVDEVEDEEGKRAIACNCDLEDESTYQHMDPDELVEYLLGKAEVCKEEKVAHENLAVDFLSMILDAIGAECEACQNIIDEQRRDAEKRGECMNKFMNGAKSNMVDAREGFLSFYP